MVLVFAQCLCGQTGTLSARTENHPGGKGRDARPQVLLQAGPSSTTPSGHHGLSQCWPPLVSFALRAAAALWLSTQGDKSLPGAAPPHGGHLPPVVRVPVLPSCPLLLCRGCVRSPEDVGSPFPPCNGDPLHS